MILQFLPQRARLSCFGFSLMHGTLLKEKQAAAFKGCLQAGLGPQDSAADMLTAQTFTGHAVPTQTTRTTVTHGAHRLHMRNATQHAAEALLHASNCLEADFRSGNSNVSGPFHLL